MTEVIDIVRDLLTGERGMPRTKRRLILEVADKTGVSSPTKVGEAIDTLVKDGTLVAVEGKDIPWGFYDKRAATYYLGAAIWKAELKAIADAKKAKEDERRRDIASDEADLAMRSRHPKEWDGLFDAAYKKLGGK